ncbi:peptidase S49 family protein [Mycobacterium kansasii 824]|nr:peptidase S49 family protein [Mycobacterium kansasii 824]
MITGKLVVRDLKERLGVGSETLRTNANADAWSIDEPFTPEQRARREAEADLFYGDFVARVAEGRNLSTEAVDVVARAGSGPVPTPSSAALSTNSAASARRCAARKSWPAWTKTPTFAWSATPARRCWTCYCRACRRDRRRPRYPMPSGRC